MWTIQNLIVEILGNRRGPNAKEALLKILRNADKNGYLANKVISVLSQFGADIIPELLDILKQDDVQSQVYSFTIAAIDNVLDATKQNPTREIIDHLLRALANPSKDRLTRENVRTHAARILGNKDIVADNILEVLDKLLHDDESEDVRKQAAKSLGETQSIKAVPILFNYAENGNYDDVKIAVIRAFPKIKDVISAKALISL
jgi:HEAT repeat protein